MRIKARITIIIVAMMFLLLAVFLAFLNESKAVRNDVKYVMLANRGSQIDKEQFKNDLIAFARVLKHSQRSIGLSYYVLNVIFPDYLGHVKAINGDPGKMIDMMIAHNEINLEDRPFAILVTKEGAIEGYPNEMRGLVQFKTRDSPKDYYNLRWLLQADCVTSDTHIVPKLEIEAALDEICDENKDVRYIVDMRRLEQKLGKASKIIEDRDAVLKEIFSTSLAQDIGHLTFFDNPYPTYMAFHAANLMMSKDEKLRCFRVLLPLLNDGNDPADLKIGYRSYAHLELARKYSSRNDYDKATMNMNAKY